MDANVLLDEGKQKRKKKEKFSLSVQNIPILFGSLEVNEIRTVSRWFKALRSVGSIGNTGYYVTRQAADAIPSRGKG